MRRRLILLFILISSAFILMACGEDPIDDVVIPSFDEMLVNERNPLAGDDSFDTYMVEKNDILMIEIHLNNPSNLPINSININGTTYRQSRFEEDSSHHLIVFGFDVLRVPGERTYTLEAIEYTHPEDGVSEISIQANNQFEVYVLESKPAVELNSITPNQEDVSLNLTLRDNDTILEDATLVLYHDGSEIETVPLSSGQMSHIFSDLLSNTSYTLRVLASFERGEGSFISDDEMIFELESIMTLEKTTPEVFLDLIDVDKTSIAFDYDIHDPDKTGSFNHFELYLDDNLVDTTLKLEDLNFTSLLSDNTYEIIGIYSYNLNDGEGDRVIEVSLTATTDSKSAPTIDILLDEPHYNEITFDLDITDIDSVLLDENLEIVLMHDDDIYKTLETPLDEINELTFVDILSDNTFTIHVYGHYDLNDGEGTKSERLLGTLEFFTPPRALPEVNVTTQTQTESYFIWQIDASLLSDLLVDDTMIITIYDTEDNRLKQTTMLKENLSFELHNLLANQTVRLVIEADYDLEDGAGVQSGIIFEDTFTTTQNNAPSGSIQSVSLEDSDISFNIGFSDPQNTMTEGSLTAYLYRDDGEGNIELIDTLNVDPGAGSFTHEPEEGYTYIIELYVDYDLRDGDGVHSDYHLSTYQIANIDEIEENDDENGNDNSDE